MSDEVNNPFEGGSGPPAAKFPNKGDSVEGRIVKVQYQSETDPSGVVKKFPDGKPRPVVVVTLDVGDGELARDFVSGRSVTEFRNKVWAVEGDHESPKVGAYYKREYASDGKRKPGQSPEKVYEITYRNDGNGGDDEREII